MENFFFEKPILNSPYEYPSRHWELDATFGIGDMARMTFAAQIEKQKAREGQPQVEREKRKAARTREAGDADGDADDPDHRALPLLPGHGHGARRQRGPDRRGDPVARAPSRQKERWALTC